MSRNHVTPMADPEKGKLEDGQKHVPKKKIVTHDDIEKDKKFDQFYKEISKQVIAEEKRIDFILKYEVVDKGELEDEEDIAEEARKEGLRERFEHAMKDESLQLQKVKVENKMYTKIHCPFKRLCQEAELVSLEMPMEGVESENKEEKSWFNSWVNRTFVTDNEVDMVSAPFKMDRMYIYQNHADPTYFFRPAIRALLVDHILVNVDLRATGESFTASKQHKSVINCWGNMKEDEHELGDLQKVGLNFMIMEGAYDDMFILHEESEYDPKNKDQVPPADVNLSRDDPRFALQQTWTKFFKFQPLWKIRNYFGEKIGFYFAWTGTLISTLWLPMIFGFIVFLYGIIISYSDAGDESSTDSTGVLGDVKASFDNDATPFFAMFLCVWGTLFLEVWKRKQSELAYEWDVEQFEENEPDRPEFYGTKRTVDPVTKEQDWYYPFTRRAWKILISSLSLIFMICLVLVSVTAVIIYRVIATIDYCPNMSSQECLLVATVISSLMNSLSIVILGKIYNIVARKLTDWENHRTNTAYNDALVIKLFGFQFVNNYSSCFYIAFVRGRLKDIAGKGSAYSDDCEGSCMSQLSFQVMILMLTKPAAKFALDIILPFVLGILKKKCQCFKCLPCLKNFFTINEKPESEKTLLEKEIEKPNLGNFTLEEYTEKVILYGLMMLFAASFPLAPLLALLVNLIDLRIDAKRMLWMYRRPLPIIAEDIGTWFVILELLNFAGVICHAFLIAFTSSWGGKYDTITKLWIVIGFEHIVFLLKLLVAYLIPDVPAPVKLALRKKRYHLKVMLDKDRKVQQNGGVTARANPRDAIDQSKKERAQLAREDTRATSPWRRSRKPATFDGDDTDVRRLKKKDKNRADDLREDRSFHYHLVGPRGEDLSHVNNNNNSYA